MNATIYDYFSLTIELIMLGKVAERMIFLSGERWIHIYPNKKNKLKEVR